MKNGNAYVINRTPRRARFCMVGSVLHKALHKKTFTFQGILKNHNVLFCEALEDSPSYSWMWTCKMIRMQYTENSPDLDATQMSLSSALILDKGIFLIFSTSIGNKMDSINETFRQWVLESKISHTLAFELSPLTEETRQFGGQSL